MYIYGLIVLFSVLAGCDTGSGTDTSDIDKPETKYNLLKIEESTNSRLSNAFIYCGDDAMATKSDDIPDSYQYPDNVDNYPLDPSEGDYITVDTIIHEDVVCFTNQAACKVGTKTMGAEMSGIVFRNIDVLKCGRGLVIDNMDTATVRDIIFENIGFEYITPFDALYFVIQDGTDWRYSEGTGAIDNIQVTDIVLNDFSVKPMFRIEGRDTEDTGTTQTYPVGTVTCRNIFLNDTKITEDNAEDEIRLVTTEADDIRFE